MNLQLVIMRIDYDDDAAADALHNECSDRYMRLLALEWDDASFYYWKPSMHNNGFTITTLRPDEPGTSIYNPYAKVYTKYFISALYAIHLLCKKYAQKVGA